MPCVGDLPSQKWPWKSRRATGQSGARILVIEHHLVQGFHGPERSRWYPLVFQDNYGKTMKNNRFNRQIMKLNRPFSAAMWPMTRRYRLKKGTHRAARVGLLRLKYVEICQASKSKLCRPRSFWWYWSTFESTMRSRRQNRHGLQYFLFLL